MLTRQKYATFHLPYEKNLLSYYKKDEALQMYADLSWFHSLFLKYGEPQYIHTTLIGVREWAGQAQHQISHEGLAKEKNYILDRYGIW